MQIFSAGLPVVTVTMWTAVMILQILNVDELKMRQMVSRETVIDHMQDLYIYTRNLDRFISIGYEWFENCFKK